MNALDFLEFILKNNYNPRPQLVQQTLAVYRNNVLTFSRNPVKFIKFLQHNFGNEAGMYVAEMFYDKLQESMPVITNEPPTQPLGPLLEQHKRWIEEKNRRQEAELAKSNMETYVNSIKDVVTQTLGPAITRMKEEPYKYKPDHPSTKAEEILEDDSKRWAKEYLTPPADTPMYKAEELRAQWAKNKPPEIPIEKMKGYGPTTQDFLKRAEELRNREYNEDKSLHPTEQKLLDAFGLVSGGTVTVGELAKTTQLTVDQIRRGIEWLKYKNLIPPEIKIDEGREKTKPTSTYLHKCNQCSATFYNKHGLANHRRAHARHKAKKR
jgi:hypothetical protein